MKTIDALYAPEIKINHLLTFEELNEVSCLKNITEIVYVLI